MEVFFLDVAQGACQIILIGQRSAIVIDTGTSNGQLPLRFLQRMGIEHLAALLTTHSHADHMGGATAVLGHYRANLDRIGFVQDDLFLNTGYWARISQLLADGDLDNTQLVRLECNSDPQIVWDDPSRNAALRTFAPLAARNLQAQQAQNPNATSAVCMLDIGQRRIIFGADAEMQLWRDIHRRHGTIPCNVLGVPHHSGAIHKSDDDLAWLFRDALNSHVAVITVGTTNVYGHPHEDVVRALTACGATVMCTQITRQCSEDLESVRKSRYTLRHVGASTRDPQYTGAGNSRNVACAGTVRVEISDNEFNIESLSEHQRMVDHFPKTPACPLCRLPQRLDATAQT